MYSNSQGTNNSTLVILFFIGAGGIDRVKDLIGISYYSVDLFLPSWSWRRNVRILVITLLSASCIEVTWPVSTNESLLFQAEIVSVDTREDGQVRDGQVQPLRDQRDSGGGDRIVRILVITLLMFVTPILYIVHVYTQASQDLFLIRWAGSRTNAKLWNYHKLISNKNFVFVKVKVKRNNCHWSASFNFNHLKYAHNFKKAFYDKYGISLSTLSESFLRVFLISIHWI